MNIDVASESTLRELTDKVENTNNILVFTTKNLDYSVEEKPCGMWIDSRTIYKKTYVLSDLPAYFPTNTDNYQIVEFATDIDVKDVLLYEGMVHEGHTSGDGRVIGWTPIFYNHIARAKDYSTYQYNLQVYGCVGDEDNVYHRSEFAYRCPMPIVNAFITIHYTKNS